MATKEVKKRTGRKRQIDAKPETPAETVVPEERQLSGEAVMPLLPLRDIVVFPFMVVPLLVGRRQSIEAVMRAMMKDRILLLAAQHEASTEEPTPEDIYGVGTIGEILQMVKQSDGSVKVLVEGVARANISEYLETENCFVVRIEETTESIDQTPQLEALMRSVTSDFEKYVNLNPKVPSEVLVSIGSIDDPGRMADIIAAHLQLKVEDKQKLLEALQPEDRLRLLGSMLNAEIEIAQLEQRIHGEVRKRLEKSQREYYLHEQMRAIQKELGKQDELTAEIEELQERIEAAGMPDEVREKAEHELDKLAKMMSSSPEAAVIRNYLDWLISVPWATRTRDNLKVDHAQKVLDEDHYGLDKPKQRILEYLAVRRLVRRMKGPILCLVGPPGVGKTSLARSIARATRRSFVRASLGGVRDEAEIRGHRRTYIGAMPGKIIQLMKRAGYKNPVFLLDEVDKMSVDFRGDPSSALLEVLDPEQNDTFNDHYLDVDFDLSDVMFITTANLRDNIPPPLQDRMEIINLPGYTELEKLQIAKRFLVPKQLAANGLKSKHVSFSDGALRLIIQRYTREAGVRNLEREIASVCRQVAIEVVKAGRSAKGFSKSVTANNLAAYLGQPKFRYSVAEDEPRIGVAAGLAWTEVGGDVLWTEAAVIKGGGNLTITGKLGDVMQESARAAMSYVRSRSGQLGLSEDFYETLDVHVHVPEGAIPKDGPSAGITIATAIASALAKRAVRNDLAMTGEITLRGRVLPIGGLKSKVLAAHRGRMKTVLLPKDNKKDLDDIPENVKKDLRFVFVESMDDVLAEALLPGKKKAKPSSVAARRASAAGQQPH